MKVLKRILSAVCVVVLSLSVCLSATGCGKVEDKKYEKAKDFLWGAYVTPPPAGIFEGNPSFAEEKFYRDMADCGFTHGVTIYDKSFDSVRTALDLFDKVGMKYYPLCVDLMNVVYNGDSNHTITEGEKTSIKSFVDEFADHPAFAGIYAVDEPKKQCWHNLKEAVDYIHSLDGRENMDIMVSHHAPHANNLYTGATQDRNRDLYTEYIDAVNPNYLCYDSYPLMYDPQGNPVLNQNWLDNAQTMAELGQEYGLPIYYFMLTLGHLEYRTPDEYRDVAWQSNLSLAYGVRGALTFTYWEPLSNEESYTYACIDQEGNKTPVYYAVQQVIEEYEPMNDVYMSFDWKGTMLIGADPDYPNNAFEAVTNRLCEHKRIKNTKVSQDTVIGTFKDGDDRDAFMIVNYSDPYYALEDKVTVTFDNVEYVSVWRKGVQRVVKLKNGAYTTTLGSGEGEFVIPLR
ncbi:MAG: hypothetical protein K2L51_01940 [Clostridiales bacterium]|nr:hypothetical protein [Clostridiales bacterium]